MDLAKSAVKEKLVRLCLAIWKNFLLKARKDMIPVFVGAKVLDFIEHLSSRKISDEEMLADMTFIKEELIKAYQSLKYFFHCYGFFAVISYILQLI